MLMPISFPMISLSPDLEVNQFRQVRHGRIFLSKNIHTWRGPTRVSLCNKKSR